MDPEVEMVDGVCLISILVKALDASNAEELKKVMRPLLQGQKKVVFDLRLVEFLDSSGLGAILSCMRELNAAGGELKLCGVTKAVRALLELVRFHRILDIYNTRDEAVRSYLES
jgi:anti-sigma B factor antagonist